METFSKKYAQTLIDDFKYTDLLSYCLNYLSDGDSMHFLGLYYYYGYGGRIDYDKSFFYENQSANRECADGLAGLAYHYLYGFGVKRDEHKAVALLNQAILLGSYNAMVYLGYCYEYGIGVQKNEKKLLPDIKKPQK